MDSPRSLFSAPVNIPEILNQKTYPSLNGLRGVSILLVLFCHLMVLYYPNAFTNIYPVYRFGALGVEIFFVISGFLITSLCIKEKVQTGDISLRSFYIRRILRILPVAYLYLIVMIFLNIVFHLEIHYLRFVFAAVFLMNLSLSGQLSSDWYTGHYWSLSTEEQFYLFFPFILKKNFGLFVFLLLLVCFAPVVYALQLKGYFNYGWLQALIRYAIKLQSIGTGCLMSILVLKGYLGAKPLKPIILLIAIGLIGYFNHSAERGAAAVIGNMIASVMIGLVVVNGIHSSRNIIFKILNSKVLSTIGILSYSIYIWQQPFLANDKRLPLSQLPLNLVFLLIVPVLSYYCFEKYFLKLKASFHKKPLRFSAARSGKSLADSKV